MSKAMDVDRRKGETRSMWLSRCQQAWLVAEGSQVCHHPEITKVHFLSQGARLSPSQLVQYNMLMMDHEWELDRAKRAYLTLDRSATEVDGKKT